jgi:hypothetical protein
LTRQLDRATALALDYYNNNNNAHHQPSPQQRRVGDLSYRALMAHGKRKCYESLFLLLSLRINVEVQRIFCYADGRAQIGRINEAITCAPIFDALLGNSGWEKVNVWKHRLHF